MNVSIVYVWSVDASLLDDCIQTHGGPLDPIPRTA